MGNVGGKKKEKEGGPYFSSVLSWGQRNGFFLREKYKVNLIIIIILIIISWGHEAL